MSLGRDNKFLYTYLYGQVVNEVCQVKKREMFLSRERERDIHSWLILMGKSRVQWLNSESLSRWLPGS